MLMFWMPNLLQARHVDLVVEVADVADDRLVLHPRHVAAVMMLVPVVVMKIRGLDDVLEVFTSFFRRACSADRIVRS
jgi:hypothetical protein